MYCGHCGRLISQETKFCPHCGNAIQRISYQNQGPNNGQSAPSDQRQDQNFGESANVPDSDDEIPAESVAAGGDSAESVSTGRIPAGRVPSGGNPTYPYQMDFDIPGEYYPQKKGMNPRVTIFLIVLGSVAIFLLLFACLVRFVIFPAVKSAEEVTRRIECMNNLKQIAIAFHNYYDCYDSLPAAYSVDKEGKPLHSWRVTLLPFFREDNLYESIHLDEPWDSEYNSQFHNRMPSVFRCPSMPKEKWINGITNYVGIVGKNAFFKGSKGRTFDEITDGTGNTIMIVESKKGGCWMDPQYDLPLEEALQGINKNESGSDSDSDSESGLGNLHTRGPNVAFADGSVRYLSNSIAQDTLRRLLIINDGQKVKIPELDIVPEFERYNKEKK